MGASSGSYIRQQVEGNASASKRRAMAAMGAQYQEAMVLSAGRNKTQSQSATSKRNGNEMRAKWERNGGAISERNGSATQ